MLYGNFVWFYVMLNAELFFNHYDVFKKKERKKKNLPRAKAYE